MLNAQAANFQGRSQAVSIQEIVRVYEGLTWPACRGFGPGST